MATSAPPSGGSTTIKNVVVKVEVQGDVRAVNALANLERAQAQFLRAQARAAGGTRNLNNALNQQTRFQRVNNQATIQAGQQLQDFFIQVQGGQNILTAFTQQGAQLAFVLSNVGGTVGTVARVFSGFVGTLSVFALTGLSILISSLSDAEEETKKAEKTTYAFEGAMNLAALSADEYDNAIEQLTGTIRDLIKIEGDYQRVQIALARQAGLVARQRLAAAEEEAAARQKDLDTALKSYSDTPEAPRGVVESQQLADALEVLAKAQEAVNKANTAETLAGIAEAQMRVVETLDPVLKLTREYGEAVAELERKRTAGAAGGAGGISQDEYEQQLLNLTKTYETRKEVMESADKDRERALREQERLSKKAADQAAKEAEAFAEVVNQWRLGSPAVAKLAEELETLLKVRDTLVAEGNVDPLALGNLDKRIADINAEIKELGGPLGEVDAAYRKFIESQKEAAIQLEYVNSLMKQTADPVLLKFLEDYAETLTKKLVPALEELNLKGFEKTAFDATIGAIQTITNEMNAAIEGTKSFGEAFEQMGKQILRVLIELAAKYAIMQLIFAFLPGGGGSSFGQALAKQLGFAKGGVIDKGVQKFARGGIVTQPTIFPMARGTGLMGEAGPEAVIPLGRDRSGNLGIKGSPVNVNVINNTGATVAVQERGPGEIDIIIEQTRAAIAADIVRGDGSVSRSIQGVYGLNRSRR